MCYNEDNLISKTKSLCDFCSNLKNKKKEKNLKPRCMLCPNIGGAVKKLSINFSEIKNNYNNSDIFWSHNICGNFLNLKSNKKVIFKTQRLIS